MKYFACFNGEDMIGFYCHWLEDGQMAIGLGLKPELTGQGLGKEFARACIEFGIQRLNYKGNNVKLMVASFNERAIKIYIKLGFKEIERNVLETSDGYTEFIIMDKKL
ncbi:GNAT family N-acetyltransferase [Clostridium sp.]|uniref:GNAT family N-acetyltransferase n=1 Tax=Clostridium sp. TaxID=1506 RepID=UPI00321626E9